MHCYFCGSTEEVTLVSVDAPFNQQPVCVGCRDNVGWNLSILPHGIPQIEEEDCS